MRHLRLRSLSLGHASTSYRAIHPPSSYYRRLSSYVPEGAPFDLLAVGFGPASLSFSIALLEESLKSSSVARGSDLRFSSLGGLQQALSIELGASDGVETGRSEEMAGSVRTCFIEKQSAFAWHPGMMIQGSKMQISFLKDLVTLRNPSSAYTFLSYLHSLSPSRLLSFISLSTFTPTRREFADYLTWAAEKVQRELSRHSEAEFAFGEEVLRVDAVLPRVGGAASIPKTQDISLLRVTTRTSTGAIRHRLTRNLLISPGGSARLPPILSHPNIQATSRVVHSSTFLDKLEPLLSSVISSALADPAKPIKLAIVGGGQSSAELFLALRSALADRLPTNVTERPQIVLHLRKGALRPADDSPFSNEVFDPGMSESVYQLSQSSRDHVLADAKRTNYSVVDPETLAAIYSEMYDQKVEEDAFNAGRISPYSSSPIIRDPQLIICPYVELTSATPLPSSGLSLTFTNSLTSKQNTEKFDAVFCGTGYERQAWKSLLFSATPKDDSETDRHFVNLREVFAPLSPETDPERDTSSPSSPHGYDFNVAANYRLMLPKKHENGRFLPTVWLQGSNEKSHGISDSLLSVVSVRAGEVLHGLLGEGNFADES